MSNDKVVVKENLIGKEISLTVKEVTPEGSTFAVTEYDLFVADISFNDEPAVMHILNRLAEAHETNKKLRITISSGGGYLAEFIMLCNVIRRQFKSTEITTIVSLYCKSAAVYLQAIGSKRLGYIDSELMYHSSRASYNKSSAITIKQDSKSMVKADLIVAKHHLSEFFTEKEIKSIWKKGKQVNLTAREAKKKGIFTDLILWK